MDTTYGIDVKSKEDQYITTPEEALKGLVKALTPGAFLAEGFPILKYIPSWIPGAGFQKFALGEKAIATRVFDDPFAALKKNVVSVLGEIYSLRSIDRSNRPKQRLDRHLD